MWGGLGGRLQRQRPDGAPLPAPVSASEHVERLIARADTAALSWSEQPARAFWLLMGAGAAIAAVGIPLGLAVNDDQAAIFRELMPGTWLSGAEMLAIAAVSWSVNLRSEPPGEHWHSSFWGLAAAVFAGLAVVELVQPTVFLSHALRDTLGVQAPDGFRDLDAAILVLLLATIGVALLVRSLVLLRHPRTVLLLAAGTILAAASQTLDSTFPPTQWEFVAEECLKLAAEPFFVAGFLVALATTRAAADKER